MVHHPVSLTVKCVFLLIGVTVGSETFPVAAQPIGRPGGDSGAPGPAGTSGGSAGASQYAAVANLIQNPSFEMDWMHNNVTSNTRFQLLERSDWGYAQSDGLPDSWVLPERACLDPTSVRFGKASLFLSGDASQVVYLCGQTNPRDGGAFYNPFVPIPAELAAAAGLQ